VKSRGDQGNVCGRETRPVNGDGSPCRFIDEQFEAHRIGNSKERNEGYQEIGSRKA